MTKKVSHHDVLEVLVEAAQTYTTFTLKDLKKSPSLTEMLGNGYYPRLVIDLNQSLTIEMFLMREDATVEPVSLFQIHAGREGTVDN